MGAVRNERKGPGAEGRIRETGAVKRTLELRAASPESLTVQDLSDAVEPVVNDFHFAITGGPSPLHDRYVQWLEWSGAWWGRVMPERARP